MKINNKILALSLITTSIIGTSCSDSFLDENCRTSENTKYLETEQGIQDMATALYGNIRWHFGYEWAYGITLYGCDEFTNGADLTSEPWNTYDSRLNPLDCIPANGASNNNCPAVSALWDQMYYGIAEANLIIESGEKITNEKIKKQCIGEAYFLRGYNHYRIFAQYGAGVVQTQAIHGVVRSFNRATEEEMLTQVISDFEQAYNLLPETSPRGIEGWTKYTAAHFLAKALLYRQSERCSTFSSKYDKSSDLNRCIELCNEVIAAHPLTPNYEDLYCNWTGINCAQESNQEFLMICPHGESNEGRFGNRTYNYFTPQFSNFSGGYVQRGQYIGGMDFQRCRPNEYSYMAFDNINDSRMWKTFKTIYGINNFVNDTIVSYDADGNRTPENDGLLIKLKAENPSFDIETQRPDLGDIGILYILNKKSDSRFNKGAKGETEYGTVNRAGVLHSFINPETNKWVPNVVALYTNGEYDMFSYGASGETATCNNFCGINKTDDGSRTGEKNDAHRDVVMARSGETYIIKAEAQGRNGDIAGGIVTLNELRQRGAWKEGEDRETYTDGSNAFLKEYGGDADNSTAEVVAPKGNKYRPDQSALTNKECFKYSNLQRNSYYISTGIARTTAASSIAISGINSLPTEDQAIIEKLTAAGYAPASDLEKFINLCMNERTRELLGEWNRWEELSRTKLLIARAKTFNPEAAPNISEKHILRPIPQTFIDGLQHDDGSALTDSEKAAWQNPGY